MELLGEVKTVVEGICYEAENGLSGETIVNDDLGIDGDEGVEFMLAFGERFAVDLTSFPHDKYFGPEAGATPLSMVKGIILRVTKGKWSDLATLRLCDLTEAAERRSWVVES